MAQPEYTEVTNRVMIAGAEAWETDASMITYMMIQRGKIARYIRKGTIKGFTGPGMYDIVDHELVIDDKKNMFKVRINEVRKVDV